MIKILIFPTIFIVFILYLIIDKDIKAQQQPNIIPMDNMQQLTMENIMLRQENLRLRICLSKRISEEECGNLVMNGVLRNSKPELPKLDKKNEPSVSGNKER